jgi:hypothetical protein
LKVRKIREKTIAPPNSENSIKMSTFYDEL